MKTLTQLLRQDSFSGADAGKVLVLNFIEKTKNHTNYLEKDRLNSITNSLSSLKQVEVYNSYCLLVHYIDTFYKLAQGNLQQYFNGIGSITNTLFEFFTAQKEFKRYLRLPLVLTEKEYSKIRANAEKAYKNRTTDLYSIILCTISSYVLAYKENKQLPERIKLILDSYRNEKVKIELEELKDDKEKIFENFANKYGIENTQEDISYFISSSILDEVASYIDIEIPSLKILKKNSDKLLDCIELFEDADKRRCNFLDEEYIDIFEQESKTIEEMSKLDALELLSEDFLEYYNFTSRNKNTAELQQEFIKEYKALYDATRDILSTGYSPLKTLVDSELLTVELSTTEQIRAGFLEPLEENDFKNETRDYFILRKPATIEDYIKIQKAENGGIAVLNGESLYSYDREILEKYSKAPFQSFVPHYLTPQLIDIYINLIMPAITAINGVNAILDVYGHLFKVDLSPLKQRDIFTEQIESFNELLYLAYDFLEGIPAQVKKDKICFKEYFKMLDISNCTPSASQISSLMEELKTLPLKETLNINYFSKLLQGANVKFNF